MAQFAGTGFSGLSTMTEEAKYQAVSLVSVVILFIAYLIACSYHNNDSVLETVSSPKVAAASPVVVAAASPVVVAAAKPATSPSNNINHDINKEGKVSETKQEVAAQLPPLTPEQKTAESMKVAFAKFPASKVDIITFLREMRKGLPVNYYNSSNKVEKKVLRLSNEGELYWSKDKVVLASIKKAFTPKGKTQLGRNPTADLVSVFADSNDREWFIVELKTSILRIQVQNVARNAEIITSLMVLANKVKADKSFVSDVDAKIANAPQAAPAAPAAPAPVVAAPAPVVAAPAPVVAAPAPVVAAPAPVVAAPAPAAPAPAVAAPAPVVAAPAAASTPVAEQNNVWRDVASTAKA